MVKGKTVCVSGYFDCFHVGHLRYLKAAAEYGDLIVILNSDAAAVRKKGYCLMPWAERAELIKAYSFVKDVVPVDDADGTVVKALAQIRPDTFCKGGDRGPGNTPEQEACGHLGIEIVFGVGGNDKAQSSSKLVANSWDSLLGYLN